MGIILYWTMFLISYFMRITRFGVEIPNINTSTGIIGAVCVALFTFGIISVRSKPCKTLVMLRNADGKVSILQAERSITKGKAKQLTPATKFGIKAPKTAKHSKAKYALGSAALTAPILGYALIALMMGTYLPLMTVSSQSMQPTLNQGDLIVLKGEQAENINVGDVVAFNVPSPYNKLASSPTIHRVVEKCTKNEETYFKTRGDNNNDADTWEVPEENVVGKYSQFRIPYIGFIVIFLKTPLGLALLVLTVAFAFVYDHYKKKRMNETCQLEY
jgi:signal peptidase I